MSQRTEREIEGMITEKDLECEMEELRLEIKENAERIDKLCNLLEQNNTKLRKIKEMNHRSPVKYNVEYLVEYLDDKTVIVNGVSYTKKEPTPIVIQEDKNTIVVAGVKYQKIEEPKPQTLLEIILDWWVQDWTGDSKTTCEQLVDTIESEWLPNDDPHDGEEYQLGWNACLEYLRKKLK